MSRFARFEPSFGHRRRQQAGVLAASTFAIGIVGGSLLGFLIWQHRATLRDLVPGSASSWTRPVPPADIPATGRYFVDVLRVNDGDTFEARVYLEPGRHLITRVRLRRVDAPELHARCPEEFRRALAARSALRAILAERDVSIWNVGPDKYGRIVADARTRRTPDISAALLAKGVARPYDGGHRGGWC